MVGDLPSTGLSSDVTSYRGDAFLYEDAAVQLGKGFGDITGGWCTGDQVGGSHNHCLIRHNEDGFAQPMSCGCTCSYPFCHVVKAAERRMAWSTIVMIYQP